MAPGYTGGMRTLTRIRPAAAGRLFAGWLLLIGGGILTPLPIPVGLLMMALGLALMARDSRRVRYWLRTLRERYPRFSDGLTRKAGRMPRWLARVIRRTDPARKPGP